MEDTNFSSEEIDRLRKRFMKLDKDGSGEIDRNEFLSIPGISSNPLAARLMDVFDKDGDEQIDFQEFIMGLSAFSGKSSNVEKLKFAFSIYDIDRDGYIGNGELFIVMKMMVGKNLQDEELQQIVDKTMMEADKDGDGKLNFEEFKDAVDSNTIANTLTLNIHSYISPKITVKDVKGSGRGIYATSDISKQELIINIPHAFLLNFTTVLNHISKFNKMELDKHVYVPFEVHEDEYTDIYKLFTKEDLLQLSSFQLLSMYLTLEKKRPCSYWKPFIDMLPTMRDFELMPLVYNNELKSLLPETAQKLNANVEKRFEHDYEKVVNLFESKGIDVSAVLVKDDLLLSWLCINSRCLYMDLSTSHHHDKSDNFTMAPYIDFINHSCDDHCTLKIDGKGFQITTTTAYTTEDQLYLSYGPHSNDFLLTEYGFTVAENKWNDLDISSYILPLLAKQQIEYLKENDYYGNFTLNNEGLSFRTEVGLAVLQEQNPQESQRLTSFLNGKIDNTVFKTYSNLILVEILRKVIHEAENHQYLLYANDTDVVKQSRMRAIGSLYKDQLKLARPLLDELE
ncbi:hypothetical protein KGF56_002434 [Candida oxycetoniae]|uniref:Calcineurin subunit B n=1 Tax=Candida oxycetoniae TaxID=497107 RepID=A0AAI9SY50_9ASCO|nr:uncharacterized protein KGF56_002434 [Candida oxycetoniae]KAI3404731.2 hypothetical protein KGF56_002434 [Candida oxycetoniae]